VRLAILISLAVLGWSTLPAAGAPVVDSDALVPCEVGEHGGYLVPVGYADEHRSDILATLPDEPDVDDFWKVTEQIAIVADRMLREKLEDAAKDPTLLFPDLPPGSDASLPNSIGYQKLELKLILEHYGAYHRQYVGLMMGGHKVVLVNYAVGLATDPAAGYVFIHRFFIPHRSHFLQCRFDWDEKLISNVSTYGPWQDSP
jgi:hypothetical protein